MERTFYQDGDTTVTNTRFMTKGQTHAMSGITSVTQTKDVPNRTWPILFGILALPFLNQSSIVIGAAFLITAVVLWANGTTTHSVTIRTSAGELKALTEADDKRVSKVVAALNEAIVFRG